MIAAPSKLFARFLHFQAIALVLVLSLAGLSILLGYGLQQSDLNMFLAASVLGIFVAVSFLKLDTAVQLFVALAPFHFLVKALLPPSPFAPAWRDVLFAILLGAWLIQLAMKRVSLPGHPLNLVMALYVAWGLMEILNSTSIAVGIFGFRDVVRYAPLYFIVLSTIKGESSIRRYLWIMIGVGLVMAAVGIAQVVLPILHMSEVTGERSLIPLIQLNAERGFTPRALGALRLARAHSLFDGPNAFGYFLAISACIAMAIGLSPRLRVTYRKLGAAIATIVLISGVFLSLSFTSMAALGLATLTLVRQARRSRIIVVGVLTATMVIVALAWPSWRDQYQDELLSSTLFRGTGVLDISNPLIGNGYALLGQKAVLSSSLQEKATIFTGMDSFFLEIGWQLGWMGLTFPVIILLTFLRTAWKLARTLPFAHPFRPVCLGVLGAMVVFTVGTVHSVPWNHIGLDVNYFVLGAIVIWISGHAQASKRGQTIVELPGH